MCKNLCQTKANIGKNIAVYNSVYIHMYLHMFTSMFIVVFPLECLKGANVESVDNPNVGMCLQWNDIELLSDILQ